MMIAFFYLTRTCHTEEIAAAIGIILPFPSEYTDDGFCGGRIQDIIRYFRKEIRLAAKFGLETIFPNALFISYRAMISEEIYRGSRNLGFRLGRTTIFRY